MRSIRARLEALEKSIDVTDGSRLFFINQSGGVHCSHDHVPDLPDFSPGEAVDAYLEKHSCEGCMVFDERELKDK